MMDIFTPEYFEKHVTTVVPIVNVDLLIKDKKGRILLSWRDDGIFKGWHVPGRIIRFKESLEQAIDNCYWEEIDIVPNIYPFKYKFIEWFETIRDTEIRGHFITFLYEIRPGLSNEWILERNEINGKIEESNLFNGFLQRFDKCPGDLIPEQRRYEKYFK